MKSYISFLVFILIVSCSKRDGDVEPKGGNPNSKQEFDIYLSKQAAEQQIPAMAVLLFNKEGVKYENYLGVADKGANIALNSNHTFLLASISKTVTATALLQLYDKGKFKLDDKINDYLPFQVKVPGKSTPITFRMLLTHTSGIADGKALDGQYYNNQDSPIPLKTFMRDYLEIGGKYYDATDNFHDFEPGTKQEYSNEGSALIGLLVEEISKLDFNEYCKQNIFKPLGMHNTFWRLGETQVQNRVRPYDGTQSLEHYTFTDYPNGGLRSTVQDMYKFLSVYNNRGTYNGIHFLDPSTISSVLQKQIPSINSSTGLHWFILNSTNNIWGHDGGEKGVSTIMGFNPENKVGVIILTNQGDANLDNMLTTAYNYALKL